MARFATVQQVLEAINCVKSSAPSFCTNFFPVQKKLQSWIEHGELFGETCDGAAFFLRKDRDLWHLYFSAADTSNLAQGLRHVNSSEYETVVTDLIGNEKAIGGMRRSLESSGFQPYAQLLRMTRPKQQEHPARNETVASIATAGQSDAAAITALLERSFDRLADQLPMQYEIEAAIAAQQIMVIKDREDVGAMLHFETQGMTSTVRYWAVAEAYRSQLWGSALMRRYLALHANVQRFLLWVVSENRDAIRKYIHYGYAADGLVDHVLLKAV